MIELDVVALLGKHSSQCERSELDSGSKWNRNWMGIDKGVPQ